MLIPITFLGVLGWVVWTIATNIRRSKATRRARIAKKRELAERSVAAINVVQKLALALAVGLIGALLVMWTPQMHQSLSRAAPLSMATAALLLAGSAAVLYAWATERI